MCSVAHRDRAQGTWTPAACIALHDYNLQECCYVGVVGEEHALSFAAYFKLKLLLISQGVVTVSAPRGVANAMSPRLQKRLKIFVQQEKPPESRKMRPREAKWAATNQATRFGLNLASVPFLR